MARFHGYVGYVDTELKRPGVHVPVAKEREYSGFIMEYGSRFQAGESINDNPVITNRVSIISDPYAREHFNAIKYVVWMGTPWEVTSISVDFPRITLVLGGVYTGERPNRA